MKDTLIIKPVSTPKPNEIFSVGLPDGHKVQIDADKLMVALAGMSGEKTQLDAPPLVREFIQSQILWQLNREGPEFVPWSDSKFNAKNY